MEEPERTEDSTNYWYQAHLESIQQAKRMLIVSIVLFVTALLVAGLAARFLLSQDGCN